MDLESLKAELREIEQSIEKEPFWKVLRLLNEQKSVLLKQIRELEEKNPDGQSS